MDNEHDQPANGGESNFELADVERSVAKPSIIQKAIVCGICIVLALASAFALTARYSNPETHKDTIEYLNGRQEIAVGVSGTALAASTAITMLPGDVGSPVAEQLANLSSSLVVVTVAVYLMKYLVTTFGFISFGVLFPLALLAFALWFAGNRNSRAVQMVKVFGQKLFVLGIVLLIAIPGSVAVSKNMESVHEFSTQQGLASIEEKYSQQEAEEEEARQNAAEENAAEETEESGNVLADLSDKVKDAFGKATDTVDDAINAAGKTVEKKLEYGKVLFSDLLDAFAILILTTCVVPLLTLALLLWVSGWLLGVNVSGAFSAVGAGRKRLAGGIAKGSKAAKSIAKSEH